MVSVARTDRAHHCGEADGPTVGWREWCHVRRVLPACLILYWGTLFAIRGGGAVLQWWQGADALSYPPAGIAAIASLSLGLLALAAAVHVVFFHDRTGRRVRQLFGLGAGLAIALGAAGLALSDLAGGAPALSTAELPALILSVMALGSVFGRPAEGHPHAANDNGGLRDAIDVMLRLVKLPSGREAGR